MTKTPPYIKKASKEFYAKLKMNGFVKRSILLKKDNLEEKMLKIKAFIKKLESKD